MSYHGQLLARMRGVVRCQRLSGELKPREAAILGAAVTRLSQADMDKTLLLLLNSFGLDIEVEVFG